jgi:hypothetical protein
VGTGTAWVGGKMVVTTVESRIDQFERLCTAPCTAEIPQGTYRLGLSLDDGDVVSTEVSSDLKGKLRLQGEFESNRGARTAGWIIGGAGQLVGLLLALQTTQKCSTEIPGLCKDERPYLVPGAGIMLGTLAIGLILLLQRDHAYVTVRPAL